MVSTRNARYQSPPPVYRQTSPVDVPQAPPVTAHQPEEPLFASQPSLGDFDDNPYNDEANPHEQVRRFQRGWGRSSARVDDDPVPTTAEDFRREYGTESEASSSTEEDGHGLVTVTVHVPLAVRPILHSIERGVWGKRDPVTELQRVVRTFGQTPTTPTSPGQRALAQLTAILGRATFVDTAAIERFPGWTASTPTDTHAIFQRFCLLNGSVGMNVRVALFNGYHTFGRSLPHASGERRTKEEMLVLDTFCEAFIGESKTNAAKNYVQMCASVARVVARCGPKVLAVEELLKEHLGGRIFRILPIDADLSQLPVFE
jgi:hypothetical protein